MSHPPLSSPSRGTVLIPLAVAGAALAVLFAPTARLVVKIWDTDPNYSHGPLVLGISLLSAGFALRTMGRPDSDRGATTLGVMSIVAGVLVRFVATFLRWPLIDFVALALILRGLAVAAGGRGWARPLTFPVVFLVFMFPLPAVWIAHVALFLQEWVATTCAAVLDIFVLCYRQGTSLYLAGVEEPLVVAQECSALRQVVAFLALGALLRWLSGRGGGFRLAMLVAAIPVAILANVLRVLMMGFGAVWFGTSWINSSLHHAPRWLACPWGLPFTCSHFGSSANSVQPRTLPPNRLWRHHVPQPALDDCLSRSG
jgi:exosortase